MVRRAGDHLVVGKAFSPEAQRGDALSTPCFGKIAA